MTSLGRLIFFDQPGTGASDPVTPGALPTLEQWADSITAVLDDLGSREAVLVAIDGAFATGALFAATHPSRTTALVVLEGYADHGRSARSRGSLAAMVAMWGTGEFATSLESGYAVERGDPGYVGSNGTPGGEPRDCCPHDAARVRNWTCGRVLPTVRVPTLVVQHADDPLIVPAMGKYVADHIPGAKYVELPGRNLYHFVEPWRASFQEIA